MMLAAGDIVAANLVLLSRLGQHSIMERDMYRTAGSTVCPMLVRTRAERPGACIRKVAPGQRSG
jgi:hypothetical protein